MPANCILGVIIPQLAIIGILKKEVVDLQVLTLQLQSLILNNKQKGGVNVEQRHSTENT